MLPRYPAKKYDVRTLRIAARRCIPIVCKHRPTRTMTARRDSPVGVRACRACRPAQARRMAIQGKSTLVWARHGTARQDETRQGKARLGKKGTARHGTARQGKARHGMLVRHTVKLGDNMQLFGYATMQYNIRLQPCNTTYICMLGSAGQSQVGREHGDGAECQARVRGLSRRAVHATYNIQRTARPLASNRACALPHSASI